MKKKNRDDFEQLLNWVEGRLPAAEAKQLEAQLETAVDDTHALIEWLQTFQHITEKYQLVQPPDDLDAKLYNIFNKQPQTTQRPRFFQQLMAALTFDSYQHLTAVGVRAAAAKLERQFVYGTDLAEITIDSQWDAQAKSVHINGQLFPQDDADETIYVVELQRNKTTTKMTATDPLGKFTFTSLAPDTYDIILSGDQVEIAMTGIELQF